MGVRVLDMRVAGQLVCRELRGLGASRLFGSVEVRVGGFLPNDELPLSHLSPGAVAKLGGGARPGDGEVDRANREGFAPTRRSPPSAIPAEVLVRITRCSKRHRADD